MPARVSHVAPLAHPPQFSEWPQPSPIVPQYVPPAKAQVLGVQFGLPHTLGTPEPPQVSGAVQALVQSSVRPQPSPIVPQ
jgi:hypothetical protein